MTGDSLRKLLEAYKFKLSDVAEGLGISPQALNSKLKSKEITISFTEEIADAIGIPSWLLKNPPAGQALKFILNRHGYTTDILFEKGFSHDKLHSIFNSQNIGEDLNKLNAVVDFDLDKLLLAVYGIPGKVRKYSNAKKAKEAFIKKLPDNIPTYLFEQSLVNEQSETLIDWKEKYYNLLERYTIVLEQLRLLKEPDMGNESVGKTG